jgi:hypothetical protein
VAYSNFCLKHEIYQRPRVPVSVGVDPDSLTDPSEGVGFASAHFTLVGETSARGDPTSGASASGAGTPTPSRKSLPTLGTNRLGLGAETPTPGAEACRSEVLQSTLGEVTFTFELCAIDTVIVAGRDAKDKMVITGINETLESLSFIMILLALSLVCYFYSLKLEAGYDGMQIQTCITKLGLYSTGKQCNKK